jgi:hypothetical protein
MISDILNYTDGTTYLNMRAAPNFTENDGILYSVSPLMSGTSFMSAITTPNTAKNEVTTTASGYVRHAWLQNACKVASEVGAVRVWPRTEAFACRKNPKLIREPRTTKIHLTDDESSTALD